jgi:hypothetical protein
MPVFKEVGLARCQTDVNCKRECAVLFSVELPTSRKEVENTQGR